MIAERIAIESNRDMLGYPADQDSTTHRLLEENLASEEEHVEDLSSLPERLAGWAFFIVRLKFSIQLRYEATDG